MIPLFSRDLSSAPTRTPSRTPSCTRSSSRFPSNSFSSQRSNLRFLSASHSRIALASDQTDRNTSNNWQKRLRRSPARCISQQSVSITLPITNSSNNNNNYRKRYFSTKSNHDNEAPTATFRIEGSLGRGILGFAAMLATVAYWLTSLGKEFSISNQLYILAVPY